MTPIQLHVGEVCGRPVRFYRAPDATALPLHSDGDLIAALRPPKRFVRARRSDLKHYRADLAVAGGDLLAPHHMGLGTIEALIHVGAAPSQAERDYRRSLQAAFQLQATQDGLSAEDAEERFWQGSRLERAYRIGLLADSTGLPQGRAMALLRAWEDTRQMPPIGGAP